MGRLTASLPAIIEQPKVHDGSPSHGEGWIVTVFDNDTNSVDEVMHILMVATKCDEEEAAIETWEVHHLGKSVVHHGAQEECESAAAIIAQIGIDVKVSQE